MEANVGILTHKRHTKFSFSSINSIIFFLYYKNKSSGGNNCVFYSVKKNVKKTAKLKKEMVLNLIA